MAGYSIPIEHSILHCDAHSIDITTHFLSHCDVHNGFCVHLRKIVSPLPALAQIPAPIAAMEAPQLLATGGVSGVVVAIMYAVYVLCKQRRSRCTSQCSTSDAVVPQSPQEPAAPKPAVAV